jgi:hypothetical protein
MEITVISIHIKGQTSPIFKERQLPFDEYSEDLQLSVLLLSKSFADSRMNPEPYSD